MASTSLVDFRDPAGPEDATPPMERVIAGAPRASSWNHYAEATGQFFAGIWSSTPGKWRVRYTEHEFCHLLEGRVILTGDDGSCRQFGPGDSWVIPAGFSGSWETVEAARKLYAIFAPGAGAAT